MVFFKVTDFTYSGSTLTFGTGGDIISVKELSGAGNLLTIVDDSSTTTTIDQGESLKITGSGGVTTSLSGDTLTIAGAEAINCTRRRFFFINSRL